MTHKEKKKVEKNKADLEKKIKRGGKEKKERERKRDRQIDR